MAHGDEQWWPCVVCYVYAYLAERVDDAIEPIRARVPDVEVVERVLRLGVLQCDEHSVGEGWDLSNMHTDTVRSTVTS